VETFGVAVDYINFFRESAKFGQLYPYFVLIQKWNCNRSERSSVKLDREQTAVTAMRIGVGQ
jgi:hypothetical protein